MIVCDELGLRYETYEQLGDELGLSDGTVRRRILSGKDIKGVCYRLVNHKQGRKGKTDASHRGRSRDDGKRVGRR